MKIPQNKVLAVIALIRAGLMDLPQLACAVGLTLEQVHRIDEAEDPAIRQIALANLPEDFVFRLRERVTCPSCGGKIFLVPCLQCRIEKSTKES